MGALTHVANLWFDPKEGVTFSGYMTLPQALPPGISLRVVAVPVPRRGRKEKWELHVAIPLPPSPPEPPGPDDIDFDVNPFSKGVNMSQWFADPEQSNRRNKCLFWGESGTGKTKAALSFPRCAYMDNHGSAEKYRIAYQGEHKFFPPNANVLPTPDNVAGAIAWLMQNPEDRLTLVLDDVTTFWDQVQAKWSKLFGIRLTQSKGHHGEFYTFQPSDWIHPKRELRSTLRRMISMDMNVILVARSQPKYAGKGSNFMEVVGQIFAGEKGMVYEFDYIFEFRHEEGKRFAIVHKQRVTPGDKPFPERFEFTIDDQGHSNFYEIFSSYVDKDRLIAPAQAVADPVKDEIIPEPTLVSTPDIPMPVSQDQLQSLVELKAQLNLSKEDWTKELQKNFGVLTARALTIGQAEKFIADLKARAMGNLMQGQGEEVKAPEPITKEQLDKLVELKAYFRMDNEEWGKTLQKMYGVTTARNLTQEQAEHYINYLGTQRAPF